MVKNNSLVKAVNKNVRTSPRKLALVCNFIKGKKADTALRDLSFQEKELQKMLAKPLNQLYRMQKIIINSILIIYL